jgi:hypothetical protein
VPPRFGNSETRTTVKSSGFSFSSSHAYLSVPSPACSSVAPEDQRQAIQLIKNSYKILPIKTQDILPENLEKEKSW